MLEKDESYGDNVTFRYEEEDIKMNKGVLPLWSILPSYEMYSRTFFGENGPEPPSYENSSETHGTINQPSPLTRPVNSFINSETTSELSLNRIPTLHTETSTCPSSGANNRRLNDDNNNTITINDRDHAWQNNVLDNVHKLNDMTDTDNLNSTALEIKTFFTEDICKTDETPQLIDPSRYEYRVGQSINGYITIENTSDKAIDFKMLYILFEGTITTPKIKKNFLQMFEFSGSYYKDTHVGRLVTEECRDCLRKDSQGYSLGIRANKIEPRSKHKRFFSFQIPQHLLDNECPSYVLSSHVRLPPSSGMLEDVLEFNQMNTTIEYNVICRFIGKAKTYGYNPYKKNAIVFNESGDEYVILKQRKAPIRIIEQTPSFEPSFKIYLNLYYVNFLKRIDEKIQLGEKLSKVLKDQKFDQISDLVEDIEESINQNPCTKAHQLYVATNDSKLPISKTIDVNVTHKNGLFKKKKSLFLSTPDVIYSIPYISPKQFRPNKSPVDLNISIPISLTSFNSSPPNFKAVMVDLVCLTVTSDTPIPIEFNHDIIFKNNSPDDVFFNDHDNITTNVIDVFAEKAKRIRAISREVDIENLKIERQLIDEIKCMASLKTKTINLAVNEPSIRQNNKKVETFDWSKEKEIYQANFDLDLDFHNLSIKFQPETNIFLDFTLVPEFQSCYISRIYYLKVFLLFSNDHILVKIPFAIVNS